MTHTRPWLPYVAPFALYMGFLVLQSGVPDGLLWIYPLKTIAVAATLWAFRRYYDELRVGFSAAAVAVGLLAIALWIGLDPYYPKLAEVLWRVNGLFSTSNGTPPVPAPFDPTTISPELVRWIFLAFRVAGASVVVPLMEELFWRGFLLRWIDNPDFKSVPIGTFAFRSFALTVIFFGVEHEQWLAGMICGALYNALLYKRKDLFSCVVAHAVSNATLAAWVLVFNDWKFW